MGMMNGTEEIKMFHNLKNLRESRSKLGNKIIALEGLGPEDNAVIFNI